MVAKDAEIPFDELASALIEGFGRDVAKKVVPLEVIVKYYGSRQLETWKNLMGS